MKNLKIVFILLLSLALASCLFAEDVGKIVSTQGRVDIFKEGSRSAVPAIGDDLISAGDSIRTKSGSRAQVLFRDKSVLKLAQNSKVLIKDYQLDDKGRRGSAVIELSRGKARAIIAKTPSGAGFVIKTPNAEGTVKGSDVTAFYQAGSSGMFVSEGKLSVINIAYPGTKIIVPKGSACVVPMDELPKGPRPYLDVERKLNEEDTYIPVSISKMGKTSVIRGAVAKVSGVVEITSKGSREAHKANINDILGDGDRIETGENGYIEIRLDNNNAINLKPNTKLKIIKLAISPETGEFENIFEVTLGKIKARIENLKGNSKFEVKTPQAICGARGTIIYVVVTQNSATAFFEGGNGYLTNTLNGSTQNVGAGQSSTSDNTGTVTIPIYLSDSERQSYGEGWDGAAGYEGYSSSSGSAGMDFFGAGNEYGSLPAGVETDEQRLGYYFSGIPFADLIENLTSSDAQAANFRGSFGTLETKYEGDEQILYIEDTERSFVDGYFVFDLPDTPEWKGRLTYGYVVGSYYNPGDNIFWTGNIDGTASDGGTYKGWIGGRFIDLDGTKTSGGKAFGIYIDPAGNGGTFSSYFSQGTYGAGVFGWESDAVNFMRRSSSVGILPQDLFTAPMDEARLEAKGSGSFLSLEGQNMGSIVCGLLGGTALSLSGENWGIWHIEAKGTYSLVTSDAWSLALGGKIIKDPTEPEAYWLGTMSSSAERDSKWDKGGLENAFQGVYFDRGSVPGSVKVGIIENGDILGHYAADNGYYLSEGDVAYDGKWQAIGGGEFSEITNRLNEYEMFGDGGLSTLNNFVNNRFVNVSITEVYSNSMLGTGMGGVSTASMNMNLYATSSTAYSGIWTAFINGGYSSTPDSLWTANLAYEGNGVNLTGQTWVNGQWTALVTGTVNSSDISGQAGGTYTDPDTSGGGTFSGVGAGTWNQQQQLVEKNETIS